MSAIIIELPVHPLSRKIMLSSHQVIGDNTIRCVGHDLLHDQLSHRWVNTSRAVKTQMQLTTTIRIQISSRLHSIIDGDLHHVGLHLYYTHREIMHNFIWSAQLCGCSVMIALSRWYDLHDIDEEDYSKDTAYRKWLVFSKKKKKEQGKSWIKSNRKVDAAYSMHRVYLDHNFEQRVAMCLGDIIGDLSTRHGGPSKHMIESFVLYCYYTYIGHTMTRLSDVYSMATSTVSLRINTFRDQIRTTDISSALDRHFA